MLLLLVLLDIQIGLEFDVGGSCCRIARVDFLEARGVSVGCGDLLGLRMIPYLDVRGVEAVALLWCSFVLVHLLTCVDVDDLIDLAEFY